MSSSVSSFGFAGHYVEAGMQLRRRPRLTCKLAHLFLRAQASYAACHIKTQVGKGKPGGESRSWDQECMLTRRASSELLTCSSRCSKTHKSVS